MGGAIPWAVLGEEDSATDALEVATILADYETDFELLNGTCSVQFVKQCWHTTTDEQRPTAPSHDPNGNTTCWKSFFVRFKPPPHSWKVRMQGCGCGQVEWSSKKGGPLWTMGACRGAHART